MKPEMISKTLVNQMLLCFGVIFAAQDSSGMLALLGIIEQRLKAGKKQSWHAASVTNICVGLLTGFKALLSLRPQPLGPEILGSAQAIFQSILAEGDICASQRRASSEGLGLLARLGNDIFTARMPYDWLELAGSPLVDLITNPSKPYPKRNQWAFEDSERHSVELKLILLRTLMEWIAAGSSHSFPSVFAFIDGCIAGGMALSTLVPATVSSISLLAKSSLAGLQIWSLHGLLLTIEAAGLSFVSHVQATLGLAMDILLSEENGWVELQQGVGRLINAIVAVLGPELAPGSIFFSRCKSVVAEISSCQETATMLESVRFTQQLVLFAPQAVSVHLHVQTLLPTLSSRQPTLRHLAVSTLRHLIEKDPVSIIDEQIEDNLFHMLDEETDSESEVSSYKLLYSVHYRIACSWADPTCERASFVLRLLFLSCLFSTPEAWLKLNMDAALGPSKGCTAVVLRDRDAIIEGDALLVVDAMRKKNLAVSWEACTVIQDILVLAMSTRRTEHNKNEVKDPSNDPDGDTRLNFGEDDENMVSSSEGMAGQGYIFEASSIMRNREKHLRYRTRVFAAECLSHLPRAVGKNPAHFDLSLARKQPASGLVSCDWLVLHVQELISLAYQISTIQFENMQPIGVGLLSTIMDKFERIPDPELPGHLLLEQYQAQLVSAVRTALDTSAGPILLEAGLQLATKILTSGIISGDQVAVKRIFSLISRPLNDFNELYYPSFAEWVSCKIKIRLLAAHASLKCYTYAFLRRNHSGIPDEYLALLPLFSKSSSILGKYWIQVLKDYSYICLCLHLKKNSHHLFQWNPFLDGIQSPLVSSKLQPCLEESWPVILQALVLDAVPLNLEAKEHSKPIVENTARSLVSGYSMVELESGEFRFLWGFALLVLFQGQHITLGESKLPLTYAKAKHGEDSPIEELDPLGLNLYEIVLPVFQCLSTESFGLVNTILQSGIWSLRA
uniref:Uncharacterized protein n=1 Tax=Fagus sylvatica TaxID=28930 RepID=A0A2N9GGF5_FAGSY